MTTLTVNLRTNLPLSKVRITITVQEPIRVAQATHVVNSISENYIMHGIDREYLLWHQYE